MKNEDIVVFENVQGPDKEFKFEFSEPHGLPRLVVLTSDLRVREACTPVENGLAVICLSYEIEQSWYIDPISRRTYTSGNGSSIAMEATPKLDWIQADLNRAADWFLEKVAKA